MARFLHAIANPDIAYILMTLGMLGIIVEIATPGLGGAGIAGVIALLLAFYSLAVLPVNFVGIALIVLAMIMFIAEIKVQSHGILGIGGAVALILGGLLLFDTSASLPQGQLAGAHRRRAARCSRSSRSSSRRCAARCGDPMPRARRPARGRTPASPSRRSIRRGRCGYGEKSGEPGPKEKILLKDERIEVLSMEGLTLVVRRLSGPATGSQMELEPEH